MFSHSGGVVVVWGLNPPQSAPWCREKKTPAQEPRVQTLGASVLRLSHSFPGSGECAKHVTRSYTTWVARLLVVESLAVFLLVSL